MFPASEPMHHADVGKLMSKRNFRKIVGLSLAVVVLLCAGCAGRESIGDFKLGPPSDFWCTVDNRSPFPPYCDPEHW